MKVSPTLSTRSQNSNGGGKIMTKSFSAHNIDNDDFHNSDEEIITKQRTCTDVFFILLFVIFILVLFGLLGYCFHFGDIYRIINGYDDCGNVCGRNNEFTDNQSGCRGLDYRQHKYLRVRSPGTETALESQVHRQCVTSCDQLEGFREFLNRCLPTEQMQTNSFFSKTGLSEFYQEVAEDLQTCWSQIIYLCLIALALTIILMLLFRFLISIIVWIVLLGIITVCFIGTIFLWIEYGLEVNEGKTDTISKRQKQSFLAFAIIATIITIIVCLVIFVLKKRIKLVIALFTEASKAINQVPLLIFQPLLTFIVLAIVISLWLLFALLIESSGHLMVEQNAIAKYVKNPTIKVTRWYNLLAMLWMTQFVIGCQHMITAGAISVWFFTRNKDQLNSPISLGYQHLVKYHLGTVLFGSLIIAIVQFIRVIFKFFEYLLQSPSNQVTKLLFCCCQCCLSCFDSILKYITRNAYIETAIYGYSFCVASRKAFTILVTNSLRVLAINSVGDFVLFLGKVLIVAITVLIGMEMIEKKVGVHHSWVPLVLAGLFAYFISHSFISIYEMTIDTIFICFCEDCERNDGISKPYFMSRGLMQFVQNSKKVLDVQNERSAAGKAWSHTKSGDETQTVSANVANNNH